MINVYILSGIIICLCIITISLLINLVREVFYHIILVTKFKEYTNILKTFMEDSYETIYKDQIIGFVANGVSPDLESLDTIKKNFIKMTFELMGKNIKEALLRVYGSEQVIIETMILYVQKKIDTDELVEMTKTQIQVHKQKDF